MKAPFSHYLNSIAPGLKELIKLLRQHYDYVSVLASDSTGFSLRVSQRNKAASDPNFTERGNVIRVYKDGLYSEYAFDHFDPNNPSETVDLAKKELDKQLGLIRLTHTKIYDTKKLADQPAELLFEAETESLPEEADIDAVLKELTDISDSVVKTNSQIVECIANAQSTHVNKMFLSSNRDLRQSYVFSEGFVGVVAAKDGKNKFSYTGVSGQEGPEIFSQLKEKGLEAGKVAEELLSAQEVIPGEYEVITSPEVTGLIAHEAFGHGVEMDMFVKDRALGKEYINKRVGSDLVTMHEGAKCAKDCTSYAFDDEGTLAGDVIEIDKGILKTGICDALSALRLGIEPTGNGKRQSFDHKVYTRMTNTLFDSGNDTLEDMIKSIKHGYLLEGMESGMEDPKHWGIQCIIERGREIVDGKLTGKIITPVVMTGYVPDLLGSISMVSGDREVFGNGMCGKGHKEWVKVADGGPYLKAKARLG